VAAHALAVFERSAAHRGRRDDHMTDETLRWRGPTAPAREWRIESRKRVCNGFYRIDRLDLSHELHGGGRTPTFDRELFVRGNVVGLLVWDRARDEVVLIEQFRPGAMHRSTDPRLVEVIAGMIDTDETPVEVAVREAREEAGPKLSAESLRLISRYLASPGCSTEEVFVYLAETDLSGIGGRFGLAEESEDILVCAAPADDAIAMIDTGEVCNALSLIALQWFALYRMREGIGSPHRGCQGTSVAPSNQRSAAMTCPLM